MFSDPTEINDLLHDGHGHTHVEARTARCDRDAVSGDQIDGAIVEREESLLRSPGSFSVPLSSEFLMGLLNHCVQGGVLI